MFFDIAGLIILGLAFYVMCLVVLAVIMWWLDG